MTQKVGQHVRRINIRFVLEKSPNSPKGVAETESNIGCNRTSKTEIFHEKPTTRLKPVGWHPR
jgi:hypothetical protein